MEQRSERCSRLVARVAMAMAAFATLFGHGQAVAAEAGIAPVKLAPRLAIPISKRAHAVTGADLNGDGLVDLIVAAAGTNEIAVLLGKADGSVGQPRYFATGAAPKYAGTGDFNHDGLVDVVVAEQDDNSIGVLLGMGDGTFGPRAGYPSCRGDHELVVADFNADGNEDVAAACWGGDIVSVFFGVEDGTFKPALELKAGGRVHSAAAADLNGDGRMDLLVANAATDDISLFESDNDGGFLPARSLPVGAAPHSVRVADVDGDGKLDLLAANNDGNTVSISWGSDAGFTSRTDLQAVSAPVTVAAADVNGDGLKDILLVNTHKPGCCSPAGSTLRIYANAGSRKFLEPGDFFVGGQPFSIWTGDLNRDGRVDVATASYMDPPSWLRNAPMISAAFDADYGSRWFKRFRLAGIAGLVFVVAVVVAWRSRRALPGLVAGIALAAIYMALRMWITGLKDPSNLTILLGT